MDIVPLLLCTNIILFIIGLCVLLWSSFIFQMDKEKDICTLATKFIWQRKYKIKILCKVSEVDFSPITSTLSLTLKSGKNILIFNPPPGRQMPGPGSIGMIFVHETQKINKFLKNNDKKYVYEYPLSKWIGLGIILRLCYFLSYYT